MKKISSNKNSHTSQTKEVKYHYKLEEMHEVVEGELVKLARPTVLFCRINELEITEIEDAETGPSENHQDNGATPPFNNQTSLPHPPPEDTRDTSQTSASSAPTTCYMVSTIIGCTQIQETTWME